MTEGQIAILITTISTLPALPGIQNIQVKSYSSRLSLAIKLRLKVPLGPLQQTAKISFFAGSDPGSDPAHAVPQMLTSLSVGYVPGLLEMLKFLQILKLLQYLMGRCDLAQN